MDTKLTPQEVHTLKRIRHVVEQTKPSQWTTGDEHTDDGQRHCFLGHMENHGLRSQWTKIESKLEEAQIEDKWKYPFDVTDVNDAQKGEHVAKMFRQKTPRGRCTAYLRKVFRFFGLEAR